MQEMERLPLVSIITPSYNQAQFIEENLLSVSGQDYHDIEHVVIDGGSADETIDILKKYEAQYSLRWISEPDKGQSDGINKGFLRAKGDILGWLNSDDTYLPGAVSAAVNYLLTHPESGWVYGDGYWINEHGQVLSEYKSGPFSLKDMLFRGMYVIQPSMFFRRSTLVSVGLLDAEIDTAMDYDFCLRMGIVSQAGYIPQLMATRRLHAEAKSLNRSTDFCNDTLRALDKLLLRPDLPEDIQKLSRTAYARQYLIGGYRAFSSGSQKDARHLLWQALKRGLRPWNRDTLIALLLIIESWLGVNWFAPGRHRRLEEKQFRAQHGAMFVNWNDSTGH